MDPLELFLHVRPVFIEGVGHAGLGGRDDVGAGQYVKFSPARHITNVDPVGTRRLEHIDVPVVDASVDRDIAHLTLGSRRRVLAGNIHDS